MANNQTRTSTRLKATFGFKSIPFTKNLDPDHLFSTEMMTKAQDRLRYLVDRKGIGVIFGAPGTGKSSLLRTFMDSLGKTAYSVCYLTETTCAINDLYREIARGFRIEPKHRKSDVMAQIKERILKLSRTKKLRPVLIIDEAHMLPSAFFDELRVLLSFDEDGQDELTLILAGPPQMESTLRLAVNEAFAQRIVIRVRLRSLHVDEVKEYLQFRLEWAGRTAKLFLPDAVEALAKASRGIPRLIDRLAEHSLLIALEARKKEINADIVTEAIDEVEP
jgi:type II secretory pathway predicted ATPase ExeA